MFLCVYGNIGGNSPPGQGYGHDNGKERNDEERRTPPLMGPDFCYLLGGWFRRLDRGASSRFQCLGFLVLRPLYHSWKEFPKHRRLEIEF